MSHKTIRVALLIALLSLSIAFVSTTFAQPPLPSRAGVGPVGTPIGDTPIPPYRLYLPVMLRLSGNATLPADMTVTWVYANMRGFTGGCIQKYEPLMIKVCLRNQGAGDSGPFDITVDDRFGTRAVGLSSGKSECLETTEAAYGFNPITVRLDAVNEVAESDEGNNTWTGIIPLPTAPVLCTPTPTPAP